MKGKKYVRAKVLEYMNLVAEKFSQVTDYISKPKEVYVVRLARKEIDDALRVTRDELHQIKQIQRSLSSN